MILLIHWAIISFIKFSVRILMVPVTVHTAVIVGNFCPFHLWSEDIDLLHVGSILTSEVAFSLSPILDPL